MSWRQSRCSLYMSCDLLVTYQCFTELYCLVFHVGSFFITLTQKKKFKKWRAVKHIWWNYKEGPWFQRYWGRCASSMPGGWNICKCMCVLASCSHRCRAKLSCPFLGFHCIFISPFKWVLLLPFISITWDSDERSLKYLRFLFSLETNFQEWETEKQVNNLIMKNEKFGFRTKWQPGVVSLLERHPLKVS